MFLKKTGIRRGRPKLAAGLYPCPPPPPRVGCLRCQESPDPHAAQESDAWRSIAADECPAIVVEEEPRVGVPKTVRHGVARKPI